MSVNVWVGDSLFKNTEKYYVNTLIKKLSKFQDKDDYVDIASAPVDLTPRSKNDCNADIMNHANHHASQRKRNAKSLSLTKVKTRMKRVKPPCES